MKKLANCLIFIILIQSFTLAGTIRGAWEMVNENSKQRVVMIATINYLVISVFEKNEYIRTYGGTYTHLGDSISVTFEFNDKHPESVNSVTNYHFNRINEDTFSIENQLKTTWKRIDKLGNMAGLWRITGRANEAGEINEMKKGDRKTLKICSEGRFQWFAINPKTKEFFGTGGGNYTFINGKYTETIEFFSRDNARVGTSLSFDAKLSENKWHHKGKSSVGKPVDELWEKE